VISCSNQWLLLNFQQAHHAVVTLRAAHGRAHPLTGAPLGHHLHDVDYHARRQEEEAIMGGPGLEHHRRIGEDSLGVLLRVIERLPIVRTDAGQGPEAHAALERAPSLQPNQ
jgi:hypothetical protein